MGYTFYLLKKHFSFLNEDYRLVKRRYQKKGAYYYITWENKNVEITVVYDEREKDPMKILVHDNLCSKTILDAIEYISEISCAYNKKKDKIGFAADWLRNAIRKGEVEL